jgi:hypothetical protein
MHILDTEDDIFDGFMSVKWESRVCNEKNEGKDNCYKRDDSLWNFLFTMKNPHGVPLWKFTLKKETKKLAIYCNSEEGPAFRYDIGVFNNCNTNRYNFSYIDINWDDHMEVNDTDVGKFSQARKNS